MSDKVTKAKFPHSFGVFSPTGFVVMAFGSDNDAENALQALRRNGFRDGDITHYSKDEVLSELERSEEHALDPIQIGQDVAKVDEYLELAKQGCGFVVLHAPEDEAAKRAVRLVKPFNLKFAEKYNRLTMEELA
jgi:hypothetical protein